VTVLVRASRNLPVKVILFLQSSQGSAGLSLPDQEYFSPEETSVFSSIQINHFETPGIVELCVIYTSW
jgi:hypothetical protein